MGEKSWYIFLIAVPMKPRYIFWSSSKCYVLRHNIKNDPFIVLSQIVTGTFYCQKLQFPPPISPTAPEAFLMKSLDGILNGPEVIIDDINIEEAKKS